MGSAITITGAAGGSETLANFVDGGKAALHYDNVEKLSTLSIGATVFGDFIASGVGTFGKAYVTGIATFASDVNVQGNLNVTGDITYDEITGRNLNITGFTTFSGDVLFDGTNDITWDASESCLLYTSPSPRDKRQSRMPSSA